MKLRVEGIKLEFGTQMFLLCRIHDTLFCQGRGERVEGIERGGVRGGQGVRV